MISYQFYKALHLTSLMVLFTGLAIQFYGSKDRHIKILVGIATLLSLVGGMGLLARIGISHGTAWPWWVQGKLAIWFVVGIGGAVIAKRFPQYGKIAYGVFLGLFLVAALLANYKWE